MWHIAATTERTLRTAHWGKVDGQEKERGCQRQRSWGRSSSPPPFFTGPQSIREGAWAQVLEPRPNANPLPQGCGRHSGGHIPQECTAPSRDQGTGDGDGSRAALSSVVPRPVEGGGGQYGGRTATPFLPSPHPPSACPPEVRSPSGKDWGAQGA